MSLETVCPVSTLVTSIVPLDGSVATADLSAMTGDAATPIFRAAQPVVADAPAMPIVSFRPPDVVSSPSPQPADRSIVLVAANQGPSGPISLVIPASSVITVSAAPAITPPTAGGAQPTATHGGGGIAPIGLPAAQPTAYAAPTQAAAPPQDAVTDNPGVRPMTLKPQHPQEQGRYQGHHSGRTDGLLVPGSGGGSSGGGGTSGGGSTSGGGGGTGGGTGGGYGGGTGGGTGGGYYGTGGGYYGTGGAYYGTGGGYYGTGGGYGGGGGTGGGYGGGGGTSGGYGGGGGGTSGGYGGGGGGTSGGYGGGGGGTSGGYGGGGGGTSGGYGGGGGGTSGGYGGGGGGTSGGYGGGGGGTSGGYGGGSGGGTSSSGGGSGGTCKITQTNSGNDFVGQQDSYTVSVNSSGSANVLAIQNIKWSFSGPMVMYSSQQTPNQNAGGFVNAKFQLAAATSSTITFDWGEINGSGTLKAVVTYSDNSSSTASLPVTVTNPVVVGYITTQPEAKISWGPTLNYCSTFNEGITWNIYSGQLPWTGSIKVVQTVTAENRAEASTNGAIKYQAGITNPALGKSTKMPLPALDDDPNEPFSVLINAVGVDSPAIPLESGVNSAVMYDDFHDVVMWRPWTGIWVPLKSWSWVIHCHANNTSIPGEWIAITDATTAAPTLIWDKTWPTWASVSTKYLPFYPVTGFI